MSDQQIKTPVVFFIFRRPETTRRVFNAISDAKPTELFIVADGPRKDNNEDPEKCKQAREIIDVDWDCNIHRDYADQNMGLKRRFSSGLNWVFSQVDEAIILEDDCLPNQDFFKFCEYMLEEYRDDKRIMNITGTNYLTDWKSDIQDYHFSVYGGIWGWATWSDAWKKYDPEMPEWEQKEVQECIKWSIGDDRQYRWRKELFDSVRSGEIDTWAYQWAFYRLLNSGLTIVPSKNLISNIGFGSNATHTSSEASYSDLPRHEIEFPIDFRNCIAPDREYDQQFYKLHAGYLVRVKQYIKYLLNIL